MHTYMSHSCSKCCQGDNSLSEYGNLVQRPLAGTCFDCAERLTRRRSAAAPRWLSVEDTMLAAQSPAAREWPRAGVSSGKLYGPLSRNETIEDGGQLRCRWPAVGGKAAKAEAESIAPRATLADGTKRWGWLLPPVLNGERRTTQTLPAPSSLNHLPSRVVQNPRTAA